MQKQNNKLYNAKAPFYKKWSYVWVEAFKGFIQDECYLKASALTFYSLLSIVPILAIIFGIAKGFGFEKLMEQDLTDKFIEQQEIVDKIIQFTYSLLESVQGGVIAGVGVLILLWTAFGLLNNIESALNTIWKTKQGRTYTRKISDFLSFLLICPLFFVVVSSLNVFISTQITLNPYNYAIIKATSPILIYLLKLFPYFLSWILFSFVYLVMPHASVTFRAGIIAGVLAGTAFQVWQWIYIKFQIGVAGYGAIYGSFAALPLFLIWLQASWLIVFAGAEIAAALDRDPLMRRIGRTASPLKAVALLITYRCIEAYEKMTSPPTDRKMSEEMGVELNDIYKICESLQNHRILIATLTGNKITGYVPARDVRTISMKNVCDAIDEESQIQANLGPSTELENILNYLKLINKEIDKPELNKLIIDINVISEEKQLKLDN